VKAEDDAPDAKVRTLWFANTSSREPKTRRFLVSRPDTIIARNSMSLWRGQETRVRVECIYIAHITTVGYKATEFSWLELSSNSVGSQCFEYLQMRTFFKTRNAENLSNLVKTLLQPRRLRAWHRPPHKKKYSERKRPPGESD